MLFIIVYAHNMLMHAIIFIVDTTHFCRRNCHSQYTNRWQCACKQEIGQTSTCLRLIATKVACEIKLQKTLFIALCFVTNFALRKVQTAYTLSHNIMTLVDVHSVFSVRFTKCNFLISLEQKVLCKEIGKSFTSYFGLPLLLLLLCRESLWKYIWALDHYANQQCFPLYKNK